jgi:hypothetical protein
MKIHPSVVTESDGTAVGKRRQPFAGALFVGFGSGMNVTE